MVKVYELTTNARDGYVKFYVRGLKTDTEARRLAKKVFGKYYWATKGAVSHYSDHPSKYHPKSYWLKRSMTKTEFLKYKRRFK
jgi:hypothetical protein